MPCLLQIRQETVRMVRHQPGGNPLFAEGLTKALFLRATCRGIRQVYGGLILEAWVSMRKFSGEMFDGAPTVVAMGRQAEFNAMINSRYFTRESSCTLVQSMATCA
jgi:hypothetical protein